MQDVQPPMEHSVPLPKLPGMFFRSLFTVARNDQAEAAACELRDEFTAPGLTQTQVARYKNAFDGFVSEVPLTLMYCLAQRVHLAQMLGDEFPWPAPGLVHVRNELEQHAPIQLEQRFHIKASIQLPARGPKVSPRRLRPLFTVEFYQDEDKVVTCTSEYQVMPKSSGKATTSREKKQGQAPANDWQEIGQWSLTTASGRDYARLSGDFNPIHLHPLLSRWFGFEQPIIHGMYMAGRAQAEIESRYQRPVARIDVTFKRPVPLPATIGLWQQGDEHCGSYQVCGAEDFLQRLEGSYTLVANKERA
ncbi:MaoC family dehydratase [Pseudidiomarina insulisalsae]|uniref:Acyl dehydratase n=1 Tax=Pseudidiomarina insulisalsae TaxID=575789 RepID=A0A432YQA3_9GAMM|nr:MaoC/PaaZ C-terminal domain-containing protein [Pseudidiomarina insulisalsae]RUO63563.1 acyl dehydratase [Pseudidiomarina insulisalsae]